MPDNLWLWSNTGTVGVKFKKEQMDAPRSGRLLSMWRDRASLDQLDAARRDALAEPVVLWLLHHSIEETRNVEFVMTATAQSQGAFLTAPPILEAMRLSGGEYELAVSAIRRETAAQVEQQMADG